MRKKKLDGTHKEKEIEEIPFISKFKMKFIECGGNEKKKLDGTHKEKEIEEIPFISKFKKKFIKCGGNKKKIGWNS